VLEKFTAVPSVDECRVALSEQNAGKNRFARSVHLLSRDADHVTVQPGAPATLDNYVSAVYVDSYSRRRRFIVTQTPLANTVDDFWTMCRLHRVTYANLRGAGTHTHTHTHTRLTALCPGLPG